MAKSTLADKHTVYMLRDPVYPNRYWNGHCIVPTKERWPNGVKGTGIKFSGRGRCWTSRDAALKAYAEYEITVALVYMRKASTNFDWHKLPSSLELVEVVITREITETTKLPEYEHATFIAGHRVGSGENRTHMEVAMKALKHESAPAFKYMVRVNDPQKTGRARMVMQKLSDLGIIAPMFSFPFFFLTNDADLMGAKLALDVVAAWDFKSGERLL